MLRSLVVTAVLALSTAAAAQEAEPFPAPGDEPGAPVAGELPVQWIDLSLVPPISLNGDRTVVNHLSLGLAAARSGRLDGLGLAPLHWTDGEVNGVQGSWIAALAGGNVAGVQAAGTVAIAPDLDGWQTSHVVALTKGDLTGLQTGGITSITLGRVVGAQWSAAFNWADRVAGVQASTVNYSVATSGLQLAVVNVGGAIHGAQVGLVNVASEVDGAQVGLVNVASESDASVGLFSWVGAGTHDAEVFATEFTALNAAARLGGEHVYGLVVAGLQPGEQDETGSLRWTMGAGVGGKIDLSDRVRLDLDLLAQNVRYGDDLDGDLGENVLGTFRALVGYQATPWLAAFAGPTLNVYAGKVKNPDVDLGKDLDLGDDVDAWEEGQAWVGFAAGLRL